MGKLQLLLPVFMQLHDAQLQDCKVVQTI